LSLVKGVVEAHGGRVAVASTVGKGTTITVLLPEADSRQGE
jgi:signal transduction histidine kinase